MKTAIRTYHPVPALQRTSGNMQDAPRIKHILKTSLLEDEAKSPPATPADILGQCVRATPPLLLLLLRATLTLTDPYARHRRPASRPPRASRTSSSCSRTTPGCVCVIPSI